MKNKRWLYLLFPMIALVLELLPYGAVCNFGNPEGEPWRVTYSYFSMIPFGYANFAPLVTALLTCAVLVLLLVYGFHGKTALLTVVKIVLSIATILSLCPLLLGITYFSVVGALIAVSLFAEFLILQLTKSKN
jgi:hypothetical protein